jgi:hypothetical protein
MSRLVGRYSTPAVEEVTGPSEAEVLMESRDLLRTQQRSGSSGGVMVWGAVVPQPPVTLLGLFVHLVRSVI